MLDHSPDGAPLLVATPRHLRKRRMHTEIPDTLLVPGAAPVPLKDRPPSPAGQGDVDQGTAGPDAGHDGTATADAREQDADAGDAASRDAADLETADLETAIQIKESQQLERDILHRRKRRVALLTVLFAAICLSAIVLALLLG